MRKLLLFPLRLCVGWGLSPRLLGLIGATMLVLLRLSIGWHFYTEGVDKKNNENWSAAPFFANAKGPFAEDFRQLVWDADGKIRLDIDTTKQSWAVFRERVGDGYGFDEEQRRLAQANYSKAVEQYEWVLAENATQLEEYELGRGRVADFEADVREKQLREGVDSLGGQRDMIRREWTQLAAPALRQIDTIWANYESDQNAIANAGQREAYPRMHLRKPRALVSDAGGPPRVDTSVIDKWIPYFDMGIGLCLLLGFFTPVASLAAAGFLASVFLSQLPPTSGPSSSYYQLIECMACLVLAGTGAGRFAGLDYFLHLIVRKVWGVQPDSA